MGKFGLVGVGLWKGFVLISQPFIHEALVAARQHAASEPLTRLDASLREYRIIDVCSICVFIPQAGTIRTVWLLLDLQKRPKPDGNYTQLNNKAALYTLISMF